VTSASNLIHTFAVDSQGFAS